MPGQVGCKVVCFPREWDYFKKAEGSDPLEHVKQEVSVSLSGVGFKGFPTSVITEARWKARPDWELWELVGGGIWAPHNCWRILGLHF